MLILCPSLGHAGTYWVDDNGTETTWASCESESQVSGTSACTVDVAEANAAAGDIVYFNDGEYNERLVPANSGSSGSQITFKSYNHLGAIIDGTGVSLGTSTTGLVHIENKNYITIDGFEVRDSVQGLVVAKDSDDIILQNCKVHTSSSGSSVNNIYFVRCEDGLIQYNEVYDAPWNGIAPTSTTNVDVLYNYVHDVDGHACINVFPNTSEDPQVTYYGNDIIGNYLDGDGHLVEGGLIYIRYNDTMVISHNVIDGGSSSIATGLIFDDDTVDPHDITVTGVYVYNNVFANLEKGVRDYNTDGIVWKNNVFYNNDSYDVWIDSANDDEHTFDYNCWYPSSAYTLAGSNKIEDNPDFTGSGDFTLTSGSPCINGGENLGSSYDDGLDPDTTLTSPADGYDLLDQDDHGDGWEIGAFVYEDTQQAVSSSSGPGNQGSSYGTTWQ